MKTIMKLLERYERRLQISGEVTHLGWADQMFLKASIVSKLISSYNAGIVILMVWHWKEGRQLGQRKRTESFTKSMLLPSFV